MALPYDEGALQELLKSRGAEIYWRNWAKLHEWYHGVMLAEVGRFHSLVGEVPEKKTSKKKREKRRRLKKEKKKRKAEQAAADAAEEEEGAAVSVSEESMCPEFAEFYQKTLQHREELRKAREEERKEEEEEVEYKLDDEGPEEKPVLSTAPPSVQAGSERTNELRRLYGSQAQRIQSLETRLQASFDVNLIRKQPKLWPVIPLNL